MCDQRLYLSCSPLQINVTKKQQNMNKNKTTNHPYIDKKLVSLTSRKSLPTIATILLSLTLGTSVMHASRSRMQVKTVGGRSAAFTNQFLAVKTSQNGRRQNQQTVSNCITLYHCVFFLASVCQNWTTICTHSQITKSNTFSVNAFFTSSESDVNCSAIIVPSLALACAAQIFVLQSGHLMP